MIGLPLLFEQSAPMEAIKIQTGAAARSGDWVSLKGYDGVAILVNIGQNNAATTAITVDKATAVAGTGNSNGITMNHMWKMEDTPQTAATLWTAITAAASITSSATGTGSSMYWIDIPAQELGAFDCVQVELGASNAANYVCANYILYRGRYAPNLGATPDPRVD